jgi:hypothetical protein
MTMPKAVKIALAIVLVALAGAITWQLVPEPDPVYQGRTLQTWVQMLRAKDSHLKVLLIKLAQQQHFIQINYTTAEQQNHRARHAFEILGAEAKSAVPAIIETVNQNISRTSTFDAIDTLGFIGPSAQKAVPCLLQCTTNADSDLRCGAIFALGKIHSHPGQVVPALTNALHANVGRTQRYRLRV